MTRRSKAVGFTVLAVLCAVASASIASGYRESVDAQLGELRTVVVVSEPLSPGEALSRRDLERSLELREVPVRFAPPDALVDPGEALGRKPFAPVPAGSYLLASQLRTPGAGREPDSPSLGSDLSPVEITVTGAGALASAAGSPGMRVDVVVAGEPVTGGRARVRVAASGVRLIALEPASPEEATSTGGDSWNATLALSRPQALKLIEAENFAREVRLIPAG
ncbi:MAG: SAF domain-containing protein [Solirubrobacterales bacterium]